MAHVLSLIDLVRPVSEVLVDVRLCQHGLAFCGVLDQLAKVLAEDTEGSVLQRSAPLRPTFVRVAEHALLPESVHIH